MTPTTPPSNAPTGPATGTGTGSASAPGAGLVPQRIHAITRDVAARARLDPHGARLVKFTNNAVVVLPQARVVLRIAGSATIASRIPGVLAAARWYEDNDIPAVRLWTGTTQPITSHGHQVTLWQLIHETGPPVTPTDLARILRLIHTAPHTPDNEQNHSETGIPPWRLPDGLRTRIEQATGIDDTLRAWFHTELTAIHGDLDELRAVQPLLGPGVIHGDAHLGNLIPSPDGAVICDFDSTSTGPREWDLTPAAVGSLRFNYPHDVHQGLVDAYGLDITTWPGFPTLRRLREFQLITSVLPTLDANPRLRPQWEHRLATYRTGDLTHPWTPYADLPA